MISEKDIEQANRVLNDLAEAGFAGVAVKPIQSGIQATYFNSNLKLTFYFGKKPIYNCNCGHDWITFIPGCEVGIISKLLNIVNTKVTPVSPQDFDFSERGYIVVECEDKAQLMYNHVENRLKIIKDECRLVDGEIMLTDLLKELKQYL